MAGFIKHGAESQKRFRAMKVGRVANRKVEDFINYNLTYGTELFYKYSDVITTVEYFVCNGKSLGRKGYNELIYRLNSLPECNDYYQELATVIVITEDLCLEKMK